MSPLAPISSTDADWPDLAVAVIRKELRGIVDVILPGTPGEWNPDTDADEGGTPDRAIIYNRPARIRPVSFRESMKSGDQRTIGTHRTTIEMLDGDPLIPEGAVLVVRHGGRNRALDNTRQQILIAEASTESPFLFITGKAE